jgi:hypothetical protein
MISCLSLSFLITITLCAQACYPNPNCGTATVHAYCSPQNYCVCYTGFVLNCTTPAISLPLGSTSIQILPNTTNYYILTSTSSSLDYTITLTDSTQLDFMSTYSTWVEIDDGPGASPNIPDGYIYDYGPSIELDF